ncbi:UPF0389 protein CG9231 [Chironomus tepperi]|uniref:UPF0389 protein CG9231 n=1 Tax=Chironomus tepperi TaxID=113505 RepID=UPI00391F0313
MSLSLISRRNTVLINLFRQSIRPLCTPVQSSSQNSSAIDPKSRGTHRPNNFEKKLLVWSGKFKTTEEIPGYVSEESVERARNKFRIRAANIMMILTFIGCGIMIFSGRKAAERGESVQKMNQEWHKEYNEKAQAEALAKAKEQK